jgi:hypothetical protein
MITIFWILIKINNKDFFKITKENAEIVSYLNEISLWAKLGELIVNWRISSRNVALQLKQFLFYWVSKTLKIFF